MHVVRLFRKNPMPTQNQPVVEREPALEILNILMRGELAAAETYRDAITRLAGNAPDDLDTCMRSHDQRATRLATHITLAGGTPVSGSGLWGTVSQVVEAGAALIGPQVLFAALEQGEHQILTDYRTALDRIDAAGVTLIRDFLLPEQIRTHGLMFSLFRRTSDDG